MPVVEPSRRHSLHIATTTTPIGPRPLHLLERGISTPPPVTPTRSASSPDSEAAPASAARSAGSNCVSPALDPPWGAERPVVASPRCRPSRRPSSICYVSMKKEGGRRGLDLDFLGVATDADGAPSAAAISSSRPRSAGSAGSAVGDGPRVAPPTAAGLSSTPSVALHSDGNDTDAKNGLNAARLALAKRHADLLRFIAQKEAKCMELRSQLAIHEAELLQLKQKWERIAHRQFERQQHAAALADRSPSPAGLAHHLNAAVLGGIKEGVEGVGRLLVAGIADLAPSPTPSPSELASPAQLPLPSCSSDTTATPTSTAASSRSSTSTACSWSGGSTETDLDVKEGDLDGSGVNGGGGGGANGILDAMVIASPQPQPQQEQGSLSTIHSHNQQQQRQHGLGLLTVAMGGSAMQPVTSLVGTAAKKWGELQRTSTFAKSQKRASILLSDVSQSLAALMSPLSPTSLPVHAEAETKVTATATTTVDGNLGGAAEGKESSIAQKPERSLLDDDDDDNDEEAARRNAELGPVLKPDTKPS